MKNSYEGVFYYTNNYILIQGSCIIYSPYITCKAIDRSYIANQYKVLMTSVGRCDT